MIQRITYDQSPAIGSARRPAPRRLTAAGSDLRSTSPARLPNGWRRAGSRPTLRKIYDDTGLDPRVTPTCTTRSGAEGDYAGLLSSYREALNTCTRSVHPCAPPTGTGTTDEYFLSRSPATH
ncbi:hypothetical protein GCM10011588_28300 [Nocardia jinanensis]|uniref:Uncharacterized protein n=1 Tax=Nocardia jinanensis TaxID=382504 RepID=A0A917RK81_9NOCA|nr:hypothetical protein GCM10011588_28300 [Nocardia jinanensis]